MNTTLNPVTFPPGTVESIHDLFDFIDDKINYYMELAQVTPDEAQQLHQMLAEHHEHLADSINDDGTYDLQGGSGVPPLNNPFETIAVMDCTTPTLSVTVRVSPCLSVQVCDCPCGCEGEAHP